MQLLIGVIIVNAEEPERALLKCKPFACIAECRRRGFVKAECCHGECHCVATLADPTPICVYSECQKKCNSRGYVQGKCINDVCHCVMVTSGNQEVTSNNDLISVKVELGQRKCDKLICQRYCKSMGFVESRCMGTRCYCNAH